ncbi:MAG: DNA mismatch repair protein MutS [Bacillota bacterium]|nr:DNA mismatch repair protein MutS [Bacillota bacterium]
MKINTISALEFNIILNKISELALTQKSKDTILSMSPSLNETQCRTRMCETTEARKILEYFGTPPLASMSELDKILDLIEIGSMLMPEQLNAISSFISSSRRLKNYLKKAESLDIDLAFYGRSIDTLDIIFEKIDSSIRNDAVDDKASSTLYDLRRKIENNNTAIKVKLESILHNNKNYFADGYVTTKNGRYVLPVKKEYKNQVSGTVVDISRTGGTYFIEPASIRKLHEELEILQISEENEIRKILYTLTALIGEHTNELKINKDCMETLDFVFAKAKFSMEINAIPVPLTTERKIIIKQGHHPLLDKKTCVPIDFEIGGTVNGIVITGPNTGGKTVALKTVGLLSIMAQCGLHVPVLEGSIFCLNNNILCDIGDGQSITENLSTFSSHITNIIDILKNTTDESLVLLDELGSGTDPAEGMGLAIAILEELRKRNCLFIATTHYPELKDFAKNTDGIINARMEFDRENLKPLYKLQIGEAGESCALYIAKRLGFPEYLLKRAQSEAYGDRNITENNISEILFSDEISDNYIVNTDKIEKEICKKTSSAHSQSFNIGDSVIVLPQKSIGIVYKPANEKGELRVQIKGKKQVINHKRIKLLISASELYPDDYDFSIIFDSVEIRKARHQMDRKHCPDLKIEYKEEK